MASKALRATYRWEELWKGAVSKVNKDELESSGLVKHSMEMCWLTRKYIDVSITGKEDAAYFKGVAHESLEELHRLVRDFQEKEPP